MARVAGRMPRSERRVRSNQTPVGIHIGLGAVGVVAAVLVSAQLPPGEGRLVPVVVMLAMIGASTADTVAVAAVALLGYLLVVGFLVNQYGVLNWHGMSDAYRGLVLAASAGAGLIVGIVRYRSSQSRRFTLPGERSAGEPARATASQQSSIKEGRPGV